MLQRRLKMQGPGQRLTDLHQRRKLLQSFWLSHYRYSPSGALASRYTEYTETLCLIRRLESKSRASGRSRCGCCGNEDALQL